MKKRKGSLLQRMMAVLLSAVLVAGMVSNAAPASVLAEEGSGADSVSGNDVELTEEETETEPAEGTEPGEPVESTEDTVETEPVQIEEETQESVSENTVTDEKNGNLQVLNDITDFSQFKTEVKKGGTVTLSQDITMTETIAISSNVTIISSGTHTINRGSGFTGSMFEVSGCTMTLGDGSGTLILDGGAVWSGANDSVLGRGKNNAGITAVSSIIYGSKGSTIVLKGNTVLQNNCCSTTGYGGAATLKESKLKIEGAKICGNKSRDGGGAVKTYKGSDVEMTGGEICHNEAGSHGGAFQIYGCESGNTGSHTIVSCKISGGRIHNNLAGGVGGGIAVSNYSELNLSGSVVIDGNKTTDSNKRGGGVGFCDADTTLKVSGQVQIKDNLCGTDANNLAVGEKSNNLITIEELESSAMFGITTLKTLSDSSPVSITGTNGTDCSRCFTSDNPKYEIVNDANNVVQLAVKDTAEQPGTGQTHKHPVCGASCGHSGESHSNVEWIPLTFTDGKMYAGEKKIEKTRSGYKLEDGNYYLADNIRIDDSLSQICIDQADVHLCLNGKTLSFGESAVWIYGGKLTLCDCAGNGAINAAKQAAVSIANIEPGKRAFIMYGGSLQGSGCDFVAGAYSKESEAKFFGGNVANMKVKLSCEEKFDPVTDSFGTPVLKTPIFIGQPVKTGTKIKVDFNWWEDDGELPDVPVVKAAEGYTVTEADLANLDIEVIATGYTDTAFQKKIQNGMIVLCQHKHVLTKHEAVPATCEKQGTGEYWKCEGTGGCGKMFSDAGGQTEITPDSVKIAALGHDYNTSEWGYQGADGHAHKCSNCDAHDAVQEHTPGAAATETTPQTCTVCGYEIAPATGGGGSSGGNENNGGNGSGNNNGGGNNSGNNNGNSQTAYNPDTAPVRVKSENQGNIVKEVTIKAEDTFDASFDAVIAATVSELADIVLTQEEKELADDGANIKIVLDIQDAQNTVSAADKAVVESALSTDVMQGFTVGQYLDVNLFKIINDNRSAIRETNKKIIVTIAVPDRLKNTDANSARVFAVVRVHNGAAEVLTDLDNSDDTITIATDRFSSYAIVYNDTVDSGVTLGDNSIPNSQKDNEPKTGDITPLELYATLAMIAGFAYLLLYFTDRERGMTEEMKKELVARLVGWAKQGGRIRKYLALAAIFVLLVYYHSIGKKTSAEWKVIYGE